MDAPREQFRLPLPLTEAPSEPLAQNITPEAIARIVDDFYAACRADPLLGPVFNERVHDWDAHLARIRAFWGAALLRNGGYSGRPLEAHLAIPELRPEHYSVWLRLFARTVASYSPPLTQSDVTLFMTRAGRMANRFMAVAEVRRSASA